MIKTYTMLTKPGIILGNAVTTAAGFALASKGNIQYLLFLETLLGLCFVIASAGVFNNYIDRATDAKMSRTQNRALAQGLIPSYHAILFASLLGFIGIGILSFFTNFLTVMVALTGFFVYLILYAFWKYRSFYGTLVGSIAGAVPPVVGYCAVSNRFDLAALLLFTILVLWQMPHFFAIAIYRLDDYLAAAIPVLPIKKGMHVTKIHMIFYILAFIVIALSLSFLGYTGKIYLGMTLFLGCLWLGLCILGFSFKNERSWAHQMFICSLVVIMALSITMSFDTSLS